MPESGNTLVVDSWVWIEYFDGSPAGEKAAAHLQNPANTLLTAAVCVAEVVSKYRRRKEDPQPAITGILSLSKVISADTETALVAGEIHAAARQKTKDFGLVDAFLLAVARQQKAKVLTGDPHFKNFPETIMI